VEKRKRKGENSNPESQPLEKSPIEQLQEKTFIGRSVSIKGELSGEEDLTIQGRVEGKIVSKQNNVTIGESGNIKGNIYGRVISIEGEVQGNLFGEEKIAVRESAKVLGDIETPRFSMGDGARFKGHIDVIPGTKEDSHPPQRADSPSPDILETMDSPDKEHQGLEPEDEKSRSEEEDALLPRS
jgi:cytoskeletal protein CcmA (bactofilin family)